MLHVTDAAVLTRVKRAVVVEHENFAVVSIEVRATQAAISVHSVYAHAVIFTWRAFTRKQIFVAVVA